MSELLKLLKEEIEQHQKDTERLKKAFEFAITDPEISLDERWELFTHAPPGFAGTEGYIVHLKTLEKGLKSHFNWYDTFGYEKYQTVQMTDVIERVEDCLATKDNKYAARFLGKIPYMLNDGAMNELKEEILAMNVESFIFDW